MHPSDAELVLQSLAGDTDAFGVLVKRYQGAVYATAYYYAGRYGAAEDISQEAFWAAYRSLKMLKEPDQFGFWLKGVTTRTAANWLRKNLIRVKHETPLPHRRTLPVEDIRTGPAEAANTAESFERIYQAIDTLPEHYRLPVVLRYLQELSYEEIARFTGETREGVRGILQRAMRQLREALRPDTASENVEKWHRADR
ncbi:MAG: sigma-70 family RNA polymerase sigma factor [Candidatus Hydrogenedens sp.]|nr:sigma-70 family RNA polymerase sigma factor [Candidatus Hydrogenedentota bacterium]NLF59190.1 sigma-70 family RNA polymerase sigma factor [Candidatus Hydrogenedens sp.]